MRFDLSAPYSQFFTESTSSVVIVTASYLCVVEFVKASTALQAALCALCVTFFAVPKVPSVSGPPLQKMLRNVIDVIDVQQLGKPFIWFHFILWILEI